MHAFYWKIFVFALDMHTNCLIALQTNLFIMQHTATNKQPTNKYRPLHLQKDLFILHIYSVEISYVFDETSQFVIETRTALTAKTEKCYWYLYKVKDDDARIHLNTPQWWIDFLVSIFPIVISSFFALPVSLSLLFVLLFFVLLSFDFVWMPKNSHLLWLFGTTAFEYELPTRCKCTYINNWICIQLESKRNYVKRQKIMYKQKKIG